jgi:RNA polymerase sigma-70 factor (ECF subfamily)
VASLSDREVSTDVIEACRRGDREAFRELYEIYKDKVYSIALYYFHGDASAAADAAQQVFLKLITGIGQFRGDSQFSTWLYRLVVNTCTDASRRAKSRAVGADRAAIEACKDEGAGAGRQESEAARAEMVTAVQAAVSSLPETFRLAVLLRYFEELSYEEMAKVLNCSMGTVASRLSRGHKMLAARLAPLKNWLIAGE